MGIKPELSVCPYCGRPFEQRYLYTSGGPGLFLSRGRRVSWPALLPPTVNVLRENNPGLEILAGPFKGRAQYFLCPRSLLPGLQISGLSDSDRSVGGGTLRRERGSPAVGCLHRSSFEAEME